MKIIEKDAVVNGRGSIYMVPQQPDDLWSLYTCISKGDLISTDIDKKIYYTKTAPGAKISIEFKTDKAEYDQKNSVIRVHGRIISEDTPDFVIRALRILEIKLDSPCLLTKSTWSKTHLDSLLTISSSASGSSSSISGEDLAVVLIPEQGLAHIFLVGKGGTKTCAKIEDKIPAASDKKISPPNKKKVFHGNQESEIPAPKERSRAVALNPKETSNDRFFGSILTAFQKHVDFKTVKHVVIAGPGGLKDKFHSHLFSEAKKLKLKSILDNKSRFVLVPTNSRNIKEVLEIAAVKKFVKETEDTEGSSVMDELDFLCATDADHACYGWKSVNTANKLVAIRTLLITEELYRSSDVATRKKYTNLLESVKKSGGTTQVLSCDRDSGKRLGVLTGVAAILRFRVPDLDEMEL
ncbi:hypothetical protein ACHQM5_019666 [Ranunculus cassubicifolius]